MTRTFCLLITWGAVAQIGLFSIAGVYYLADQDAFAQFTRSTLQLAIQWETVTSNQLYGLWLLTALDLSVGMIALYFLYRAFKSFAQGEFFSAQNSKSLKRFAIFLFAQACLQPLHGALASVLLSLNHPAGQKLLSLSIGSNEVRIIAIAMILWVISELLIKGRELANENQAFV